MTDLAKYGPWAVIAGGSEGVGAEFARMLAEDGFNLVLLARKPGPLEATAQLCRKLGVQVRTLAVDLVDGASTAQISEATADLEVGLLIYNAGANTCSERFLDAPLAEFQKVVELNVTRMMELVQHFGRPMAARGRGGILLVGSLAATPDRCATRSTAGSRRTVGCSPKACGWNCGTTTSTYWSSCSG
ncbi:short-chain dehydrogenase/reductase SDR [Mycolicibacterium conceptionense]|uniref:Short-chain dehydrogenase/reductase SDR n=1 Tax=Mycolicibacterium conceptionense TaxID=451644 RepID=A0A0U1DLK4_9MYCO|nr:short-chain dehydrogenase/reductase SDR [Mycolicibacterium conceptionense]